MIALLLIYSIPLSYAAPYTEEWEQFKAQYNKQYNSTEEENLRMNIFYENKRYIEKHNVKFRAGLSTFELGMNQYGDKSQEEFEKVMLGVEKSEESYVDKLRKLYKVDLPHVKNDTPFFKEINLQIQRSEAVLSILGRLVRHAVVNVLRELETMRHVDYVDVNGTVDWVKAGAVTPARDQGSCGSCWAFSAVGALEGQMFRKYGKLEPLSVQNLIDCTLDSNSGCEGGLMRFSFEYVIENGGLASEKNYPYEMKDAECRYDQKMVAVTCKSFLEVQGEPALKYVLKERGPLSVTMDASTMDFRFYKSGFYESLVCSARNTNHAVLLAGYGETDHGGYWLIKNSWGTTWGENGTAKVSRWRSCGIDGYGVCPII